MTTQSGASHFTADGRDEIVMVSAEELGRFKRGENGHDLVQALQSSPHHDIDLEPEHAVMPVCDGMAARYE